MSEVSAVTVRNAILKKDRNKKILKIEPLETLGNPVFRVTCSSETYYFKVFSPSESNICKKLEYIYNRLDNEGIPVPKVFACDPSFPYIIISEISGSTLSSVRENMKKEDLKVFYYDLGRILGKIHSLKWKRFGEPDGSGEIGTYHEINTGPFDEWAPMHLEMIEYRLKFLKSSKYFSDLVPQIRDYFSEHSKLLISSKKGIKPMLLHIDLNQKNIIVKNNKISGIVDFDGCFIGHSEEELMRTECANFPPQKSSTNDEGSNRGLFFKGYDEFIERDLTMYSKRRLYYYFSRLLVHIACLVQYKEKYASDVEGTSQELREEILKILRNEEVTFDKNN